MSKVTMREALERWLAYDLAYPRVFEETPQLRECIEKTYAALGLKREQARG